MGEVRHVYIQTMDRIVLYEVNRHMGALWGLNQLRTAI